MWTISNSHAKSLIAGIALSLVAATSIAADEDFKKYQEVTTQGKHAITVKTAEIVALEPKQQASIYGKSSVKNVKQDSLVIKVVTQDPVNLSLSSSPTITVNGKAVLTKFEPHQATTFYAFVDKGVLQKGTNTIDMIWPGMAQSTKETKMRHPYQLELKK